MLKSDQFASEMWNLIEQTKGDEEKLQDALSVMPKETFVLCYKEFRRAMRTMWDRFDALGFSVLSLIPDDQISEDGLDDIYSYVVCQGRAYYDEIAQHPERLCTEIDPDDVFFCAIPGQVFWERFGEEIVEQ